MFVFNSDRFYQQRVASRLTKQMTEVVSLLNKAVNAHSKVGQKFTLNTPAVFFSLENLSVTSLANRDIALADDARLRLPFSLNLSFDQHRPTCFSSSSIFLVLSFHSHSCSTIFQSMLALLAWFGATKSSFKTNLSRSVSPTLMDENGDELPLRTSVDRPLETFIPRHPSSIVPPMSLHNVTDRHGFDFHQVYLDNRMTPNASLHSEVHPLVTNTSYLFLYRFDHSPVLTSSVRRLDGSE